MGYEDFLKRQIEIKNREEMSLEDRRILLEEANITLENAKTVTEHMQIITNESGRVADVAANSERILSDIDEKFERCTGLNSIDISFLFLAIALQIVRQYVVTKFPERLDDQTAAKQMKGHAEEHLLKERVHKYYNPSLEEIKGRPVPFDANIGANGALSGGKQMGHRVTALGHDPILGLLFGTANIATSTLTNKDLRSYHIYTRENSRDVFKCNASTAMVLSKTKDKLFHEGLEGKRIVGYSLYKEIMHLASDLHTKNSLPLPFVSAIDSELAADLAKRGLDMSNIITIGKQTEYSIFINTLISMIHGLFFDESVDYSRSIYEIRTRKILSYSNFMASASNLIYVGGNVLAGNEQAIKNLDIGGLMVTVYRIATDTAFIQKMKQEFIEEEFFARIRGSEYDFE